MHGVSCVPYSTAHDVPQGTVHFSLLIKLRIHDILTSNRDTLIFALEDADQEALPVESSEITKIES